MVLVIALGLRLGFRYQELQDAITKGISNGLEAILILVAVGALIGTWIAGGIVPTLIYYGLEFIHPSIFLLATLIICSITSIATGTSWGTVGTAGIAMMAIGEGLGLPLPLVAGAVLSGAYFGDKLSPLSDSTVLAASMAKVDVIAHVRAMLVLDVPAYIITSIMFTVAGWMYGGDNVDLNRVEFLKESLLKHFDIKIWMLVPAIIVIVLLAMKKPSMPTIAMGALLGAIWATVFQGMHFGDAIGTAYNGFSIQSGVEFVDKLLNRGGINGMLGSVAVIIFGLGFGGMPINLRIFTTPSDKNVILSKKLARKGDIFMNLSIQDELQLFSEELYRHLTPSLLEELAKELGFVKRKRKFSGNELATICIWVSQRTASDSLVRLCSQLHAATGTLMSPEGLNKRFDKKRLNF